MFLLFQNRCGHALPPVWVFGMVDASHIPSLGYMEIVDQRDAATLLPMYNLEQRFGLICGLHTMECQHYQEWHPTKLLIIQYNLWTLSHKYHRKLME